MKCELCGSEENVKVYPSLLKPNGYCECQRCYELIEQFNKGEISEEQCRAEIEATKENI
jgi:hypothetical protein